MFGMILVNPPGYLPGPSVGMLPVSLLGNLYGNLIGTFPGSLLGVPLGLMFGSDMNRYWLYCLHLRDRHATFSCCNATCGGGGSYFFPLLPLKMLSSLK